LWLLFSQHIQERPRDQFHSSLLVRITERRQVNIRDLARPTLVSLVVRVCCQQGTVATPGSSTPMKLFYSTGARLLRLQKSFVNGRCMTNNPASNYARKSKPRLRSHRPTVVDRDTGREIPLEERVYSCCVISREKSR
jgi:hypothetical protein